MDDAQGTCQVVGTCALPTTLRNPMSGTWTAEDHMHVDMRNDVRQVKQLGPFRPMDAGSTLSAVRAAHRSRARAAICRSGT
jgi:hypothetical protein